MQRYYYFRWKDPNCNGVNPEWVEMTGMEFFIFRRSPEGKKRFFIVLDDYVNWEADIIFLESTQKNYKKWDEAHQHEKYLYYCNEGYTNVSLQDRKENSDGLTYEEIIADENVNIEEDYLTYKFNQLLRDFCLKLPDEHRSIAYMFLNNVNGKSERKIAAENGIPKTTMNRRKNELRKKIEEFLGQNGFLFTVYK